MAMQSFMKRRKTFSVQVGKIVIGDNAPISIQSMVNISLKNVEKCFEQIQELSQNGCDIVRLAVMNFSEALALEKIKTFLIQEKDEIPLVADVHFFPEAALKAVEFVEKIRINPGNFVDQQSLKLSDQEFFDRLSKSYYPLIEKCKKFKRALRIGVNHGSLSLRILEKYGNTVQAMVESAKEFLKPCLELGFNQVVLSLKASDPEIMIQAYETLALDLDKKGWHFPFHLGVTEAGLGMEARMKSSLGIASLLSQGIGDTIRISLTENPLQEVLVAKNILKVVFENPLSQKTFSLKPRTLHQPKLFLPISFKNGFKTSDEKDLLASSEKMDFFLEGLNQKNFKKFASFFKKFQKKFKNSQFFSKEFLHPLITPIYSISKNFSLQKPYALWVSSDVDKKHWKKLLKKTPQIIFFEMKKKGIEELSVFFHFIARHQLGKTPIVLYKKYSEKNVENIISSASYEMGTFLLRKLGEGCIVDFQKNLKTKKEFNFSLMQATKRIKTRAEFISCPGCGRTQYDLMKLAALVKEKTKKFQNLKIAVMGCIVNGPGEMGDADLGLVGSKKKCVHLYYKGKCVEKDILEEKALDRLLHWIQEKNYSKDQ